MNTESDERERPGEESGAELGRKYPILLVESNPEWPARYEAQARFLVQRLGRELILRTEHFGSTAVAGLLAKDVIDILVEVPSFEIAKRVMIPALEPEGYAYVWQAGQPPGHINFYHGYGDRGYLEGVQVVHLHVAPRDHPVWERLLFRDYLRRHSDAADAYAELKTSLAKAHRYDREAYTEAKTGFVEAIMERARREGDPSGGGLPGRDALD